MSYCTVQHFYHFTSSFNLYTWMSCVLPSLSPCPNSSLLPFFPSLLTSLSPPSFHISLSPPLLCSSPHQTRWLCAVLGVWSTVQPGVCAEETHSHAEASKGSKTWGLREGRTAGGGGKGHNLIHILTVDSVQYTPCTFFACFVAWQPVANTRLGKWLRPWS